MLHQLEGLCDVEEDREDVVVGARAHADHIRQQQRGDLLQLRDVRPAHHQLGCRRGGGRAEERVRKRRREDRRECEEERVPGMRWGVGECGEGKKEERWWE